MTKKILLVDDEPELVELVEERLSGNGYDVITAEDGQKALEMTKKHHPDLIILDLMLPKMDGYKVCGLLKKDARYAKIPIALFTARAQEEDRKMGFEAGCDVYITKPFDPEVFLTQIGALIGT